MPANRGRVCRRASRRWCWPPCRCEGPSSSASRDQSWIPGPGSLVGLKVGWAGAWDRAASVRAAPGGSAGPRGVELHPCPEPQGL